MDCVKISPPTLKTHLVEGEAGRGNGLKAPKDSDPQLVNFP